MRNPPRKRGTNYINKSELYEEMKAHRAKFLVTKAKGERPPRVTDSLAKSFMAIANGVSERANWAGYSYIEDMRLDAIENCIRYVNVFDPERSKNPFGFFSIVVWNSFIRTLKKEKKQEAIQKETVTRMVTSIDPSVQLDEFDKKDITNALIVWLQTNEDLKAMN